MITNGPFECSAAEAMELFGCSYEDLEVGLESDRGPCGDYFEVVNFTDAGLLPFTPGKVGYVERCPQHYWLSWETGIVLEPGDTKAIAASLLNPRAQGLVSVRYVSECNERKAYKVRCRNDLLPMPEDETEMQGYKLKATISPEWLNFNYVPFDANKLQAAADRLAAAKGKTKEETMYKMKESAEFVQLTMTADMVKKGDILKKTGELVVDMHQEEQFDDEGHTTGHVVAFVVKGLEDDRVNIVRGERLGLVDVLRKA